MPKRLTKPMPALFITVVLAFGLLAFYIERQQRELEQAVYDQCLMRHKNVNRLNDFYIAMTQVERNNPFQTTGPAALAVVNERVALYQSLVLTPAQCTKP